MQTLSTGYKSVSLLLNLNWDLLFSVGVICLALLAGSFFGSALLMH